MIHDNIEDREEYIQHLKDVGSYNQFASDVEMRIGHIQYWKQRDQEKSSSSSNCPQKFEEGSKVFDGKHCEVFEYKHRRDFLIQYRLVKLRCYKSKR